MKVYETVTLNMDLSESTRGPLFSSMEKAIDHLKEKKKELETRKCESIELDGEGSFTSFNGKEFLFSENKNKPALYYLSFYGNYRSCIFVREHNVF